MDLLRVSTPYKSMNDSQKERIVISWIENYSKGYKELKDLKNKIEEYLKTHNRDELPDNILLGSLREQPSIFLLTNGMWGKFISYMDVPYVIIAKLKEVTSLFREEYEEKIVATVEFDSHDNLVIIRDPSDFPWVIDLQVMLNNYVKIFDQFVKEILSLLNKLCKTPLKSENKILSLINHERVKEIKL